MGTILLLKRDIVSQLLKVAYIQYISNNMRMGDYHTHSDVYGNSHMAAQGNVTNLLHIL